MIGPVVDGSTTVQTLTAEIPTDMVSFDVYDCNLECITVSVRELDCGGF
jgi:hypothetical protein